MELVANLLKGWLEARMLKRLALALLVSILVSLAAGTLYYWRASQPYRAQARRMADEAGRDIATIANMKDDDRVTIPGLREKQTTYAKQSREIEAMRAQARRRARIAAGISGVAVFVIWTVAVDAIIRRRQVKAG